MKDVKLEVTINAQRQVRVVLGGDKGMYIPLLFEAVSGMAEAMDERPETLVKALHDAFEWLEKREEAGQDKTARQEHPEAQGNED